MVKSNKVLSTQQNSVIVLKHVSYLKLQCINYDNIDTPCKYFHQSNKELNKSPILTFIPIVQVNF